MKEIPLTQGRFALVDDEDYEYLMQWKWHCTAQGYARRDIYLGTVNGKKYCQKPLWMHREILKQESGNGFDVDHINSNTLDNRKENLRIATESQNTFNRSKNKRKCHSKYKGVTWHKKDKKWQAYLRIEGKSSRYLGSFTTEKDAAIAYNNAAIKQQGEFAKLNVISDE